VLYNGIFREAIPHPPLSPYFLVPPMTASRARLTRHVNCGVPEAVTPKLPSARVPIRCPASGQTHAAPCACFKKSSGLKTTTRHLGWVVTE
jgi:hypothetical protein